MGLVNVQTAFAAAAGTAQIEEAMQVGILKPTLINGVCGYEFGRDNGYHCVLG